MSFKGEMDDFVKAFETGSRIQLNWRNADLVKSKTKHKIKPGQEEEVPSTFGEPGAGIGVTNAPSEGGRKTGGRGPNPNSLAPGYKNPRFDHYRRAISSIESGSPEGNYQALGRVVNRQGDRALGRYQVMASNLPSWSKMIVGQEMSVDQFLNDPEAQDKIFDGIFVGYVAKYGERGAAQAWFAGPGNVGKDSPDDINGMTNKRYADDFIAALGDKAHPTGYDPNEPIEIPKDAWWGPTDKEGRPLREKEEQDTVEAIPDDSATPTEPVEIVIDVPEAPEQQPIEAQLVPNEEPVGMQRGGAIPDDTQYFADGGAAARQVGLSGGAYTPNQNASGGATTARRIQLPTGGGGQGTSPAWRSWGEGGSPAQQKLRTSQANLAASRKAAADKAAADAAAQRAHELEMARLAALKRQQPVQRRVQEPLSRGGGDRSSSGYGYSGGGPGGSHGFGGSTGSATGGWGGGSSARSGGLYEEGGMIEYKRGGPVPTVTPEQWKKALSHARPTSGRAEEAGQTQRDVAAKGLNRQIRGITSSAIRIAKPAAAAAPAATVARPRTGAPKKGPPTTTVDKPKTSDAPVIWSSPARWTYDQNQPGRAKIYEGGKKPDAGIGAPAKPLTKEEKAQGQKIPWNSPRRFRTNPKAAPYNSGKVTITVPKTEEKEEAPVVLWSSPKGKPNAGTSATKFEQGGAIPDDTQYFEGGGRAEAAGYTTPAQRAATKARVAARKKDPWEGLRTKTSQKKRPKSTTKKQVRNQAKRKKTGAPKSPPTPTPKPARETPERGPIPPERPGREGAAGPMQGPPASAMTPREQQGPPMPSGTSPSGTTFGSDLLKPIGELREPTAVHPPNPTVGTRPRAGHPPNPRQGTTRPYNPMPDTSLPPGSNMTRSAAPPVNLTINMPSPERFGRGPAEPSPERFGHAPPPEPNPERFGGPMTGGQAPPGPEPGPDEMEPTPWLAFQRGGAIPDEGEGPYPKASDGGAGYTTSSADQNVAPSATVAPPSTQQPAGPADAEQEPTRTSPEPSEPEVDFDETVARTTPAVQAGIKGIQEQFGIGGAMMTGGIPTPEEEAASEDGIRRFAQGEGASTKQEIKAIDFATGVDQIRADEGTKNLIRADRVMQWYLQNGDEDRAKTAAASVLLYGAQQVKQAGIIASAALQEYQQTGDPQDLRNASIAVQRAHQMIPDGWNMKIDIDPKTRQIVATTVDSKGRQQQQVVDPQSIPGMLQSAMDGSAYWSTVFGIGMPEIARTREAGRSAAARQEDTQQYEEYKFRRGEESKIGTEERAAARKLWEHERDTSEGRTENEREDRVRDAFFQDWNDRVKAAETPEEKTALANEGMGYRFDNTKDRSDPINDDELIGAVQERGEDTYDAEDLAVIADIARAIAMKNDGLDASGAAEYATALVTAPTTVRSDGTIAVEGGSLVFNPMLLPQLNELRRKYRTSG